MICGSSCLRYRNSTADERGMVIFGKLLINVVVTTVLTSSSWMRCPVHAQSSRWLDDLAVVTLVASTAATSCGGMGGRLVVLHQLELPPHT